MVYLYFNIVCIVDVDIIHKEWTLNLCKFTNCSHQALSTSGWEPLQVCWKTIPR